MADEELKPFNPHEAMGLIKDRIRHQFAELIPEDRWKELVQGAIDSFFRPPPKRQGYRTKETSEFDDLVATMLKEEVKTRMRAVFDGEGWTRKWSPDPDEPGTYAEEVRKVVSEKTPELIQAFFAAMVSGVMSNASMYLSNVDVQSMNVHNAHGG